MDDTADADWAGMLDAIRERLAAALATTDDSAIAAASLENSGACSARTREWDALSLRLDALPALLEQADGFVNDVDAGLAAAAEPLATSVAACAALRQQLAEWTARAIA